MRKERIGRRVPRGLLGRRRVGRRCVRRDAKVVRAYTRQVEKNGRLLMREIEGISLLEAVALSDRLHVPWPFEREAGQWVRHAASAAKERWVERQEERVFLGLA